jgi:N-acetylmuramoyl-L-alanine amidase
LIKFLGSRGASAVAGLFMLALGSSEASAQVAATAKTSAYETAIAAPSGSALNKPASTVFSQIGAAVVSTVSAVATVTGSILQAKPAQTVTVSLAPEIAKEAAWLHNNGWPLQALAQRYSAGAPLDDEAHCIAVAVYHEARGESVEGQLAVARVIMNRAASGRYPTTWCKVVKQPWQFSFVNPRTGHYPSIDENSDAWQKALGITRLAVNNAVPSLSNDVLWYHADYVAPSWGRRLTRVDKIGTHIFYRA